MSMAVASAAAATAQPGAYNGVKVGDLCAVSECAQQLRGSVYLVNKTHVQIVGLNVVPKGIPTFIQSAAALSTQVNQTCASNSATPPTRKMRRRGTCGTTVRKVTGSN
jgi:hypothetical protein